MTLPNSHPTASDMCRQSVGTAADHAKGRRERREIVDWLTDQLTRPDCPLTTQQMNYLRMVAAYFPEGRETAEKIDRIFGGKPELRQAILLTTIVTCLDRLIA
jgi:hypothetical protein